MEVVYAVRIDQTHVFMKTMAYLGNDLGLRNMKSLMFVSFIPRMSMKEGFDL